jgi:hypothetical protein
LFADGFGVGYTSISTTYKSMIKAQYAYMSDGKGREISTTSRSDVDGAKGFGFRLQDYVRLNENTAYVSTANATYIGKHFAGVVKYDSKFGSYDGVATSYYEHTWDKASIKSITFTGDTSKTAGVSAEITDSQYSFPAFSSDARF